MGWVSSRSITTRCGTTGRGRVWAPVPLVQLSRALLSGALPSAARHCQARHCCQRRRPGMMRPKPPKLVQRQAVSYSDRADVAELGVGRGGVTEPPPQSVRDQSGPSSVRRGGAQRGVAWRGWAGPHAGPTPSLGSQTAHFPSWRAAGLPPGCSLPGRVKPVTQSDGPSRTRRAARPTGRRRCVEGPGSAGSALGAAPIHWHCCRAERPSAAGDAGP